MTDSTDQDGNPIDMGESNSKTLFDSVGKSTVKASVHSGNGERHDDHEKCASCIFRFGHMI